MRFVFRTFVLYGGGILVLALLSLTVLSGEAYAVTFDVSIQDDRSFLPVNAPINIGDTVRWTNDDTVDNQVSSANHPSHDEYPDPKCSVDEPNCWDSFNPLIAPTTTWSFTFQCSGTWGYHNHLKPGKTGTVTVTDVNSIPPAVTGLSGSGTADDSIYLTWASPGDDQGTFVGCATPGVYDIRYSTDGAITEAEWAAATPAAGEPAPQVAGASESMTVTGLDPETEYYFALKTDDNDLPLTSTISNSPNATTLAEGAAPTPPSAPSAPIPDTQAPNPPKNVEVSVGDSFVTFTWTNTLDADFSHMRFYRSEEKEKLGDQVADNVLGTEYTDRDLMNGVTYYYTLKSVDAPAGNESTNKDQVSAVPVAAVPLQETSAAVTQKEGGEVLLLDGEQTLLTIIIPPFAVDENVDMLAKALSREDVLPNIPLPDEFAFVGTSIYDIQAFLAFSGEPTRAISPFPMELTVTYTDEDIAGIEEGAVRLAKYDETNATWYVLEDAQQDMSANRMTYLASSFSRFALVLPDDSDPPGLPTNIEGTTSARDVNTLTWELPEDTDFHHVRVYRSEVVDGLGSLVTPNITGNQYNDGAAQAGVDYYYTLFSVDRSGNIVQEGVTVFVEAPPAAPTHPNILTGEHVQIFGSPKVWFVQKRDTFTFLRHVFDPQVPMFYAHLASTFWERIQFVEVFDTAVESHWVRCSSCAEGENEKVWEMNADGTRHWLNMTLEQFVERLGGDAVHAEAAIFEINEAELSYYVSGPDVLP